MNISTIKRLKRTDAILRALYDKPRTIVELAEVLGTVDSNVWAYLNRMRKATPKLVYISGYVSNTGKYAGRPAPVYSAGSKPDVEFVPLNIRGTKTSAAERREQILALLTEKKMTTLQLAAKLHLCGAAVQQHLKHLRDDKKVYIAKYQHPKVKNPEGRGSSWAPLYAVGSRKDAPRPKKETTSERHARLRKDPEYLAYVNKRRRLRHELAQIRKKPQNIFSALGL